MRRGTVFLGTFLVLIGTLRLGVPFLFGHLMALDAFVALLAIGVGVVALVNGSSYVRLVDLRVAFKALGATLLLCVLIGINSPTFGDIRQTYIPITDLFVVLESSIVMFLLASEEPDATEALSSRMYISLVVHHFYHRLSVRLSPALAHSRRKHAQ